MGFHEISCTSAATLFSILKDALMRYDLKVFFTLYEPQLSSENWK